jgi:DNA-binding NtrC family response regulator
MSKMMSEKKNNLRLLLVEDDEFVREAAKRVLELQGFVITAVGDGSSVMRVFYEQKFDLAVIDINLPGGGGIPIYKEIRSRFPKFPMVLISGDLEPGIVDQFKEDIYLSFVHKPYDPIQMGQRLISLCVKTTN